MFFMLPQRLFGLGVWVFRKWDAATPSSSSSYQAKKTNTALHRHLLRFLKYLLYRSVPLFFSFFSFPKRTHQGLFFFFFSLNFNFMSSIPSHQLILFLCIVWLFVICRSWHRFGALHEKAVQHLLAIQISQAKANTKRLLLLPSNL